MLIIFQGRCKADFGVHKTFGCFVGVEVFCANMTYEVQPVLFNFFDISDHLIFYDNMTADFEL